MTIDLWSTSVWQYFTVNSNVCCVNASRRGR